MRLRVKFFGSVNPLKTSFSGQELYFDVIEDEINRWLIKNPNMEVIEIKQSTSGGSFAGAKLIVSVWYRNCKEAGSQAVRTE